MAAPFPTPSAGDVWGQQLLDAITERLNPVVRVVTGSEPRPAGALVLWVGGEVQPENMGVDDLWFAENATVPVGYEPQAGEHSIWGTTPYPYAIAKATDSPLTVSTMFYSYGVSPDVSAWRVVGMKVWIPAGVNIAGPLACKAWLLGPNTTSVDLGSEPTATGTITDLLPGEWNAAYFNVPIETNAGDYIRVGYHSGPSGEFVGLTPAGGDAGYITALDGSHIVMSENNDINYKRSSYKYDGGPTVMEDSSPDSSGSVYGIDIIYDEGA